MVRACRHRSLINPHLICRWMLIVVACIVVSAHTQAEGAQDSTVSSTVTFQTADMIYLDRGRTSGVAIGDTVQIRHGDSLVATVIVEHVSSNSASCRPLSEVSVVAVGDEAVVAIRPLDASADGDPIASTARATRFDPSMLPPKPLSTPPLARVNGSIRLAANSWNADGDDRDYMQSMVTANVTAQQIAGRNLTLRIRSNGRRNERGSASSVADEWTSNINLFSLEYLADNGIWGIEAGRFLPGRLGLAGYVDGARVQVRPSSSLTLGAFGGLTPQWQFSTGRTPLRKAGLYAKLDRGSYRTTLLDVSVGVLGEYSSTDVSREMVFSRGRVMFQRQWSISHTVELDVNRGWRAEREGASVTLSSASMYVRRQFEKGITVHTGYTHHRRTLEEDSRATPDSLFDTRARQRWRLGADWSLPNQVTLGAEFGFRHLSGGDDQGSSYSVNARKRGLWDRRASIDVRALVFTDADAEGTDVTARVSQLVGHGHYVSAAVGRYHYSDATQLNERDNRWGELGLRLNLGQRLLGDMRFRQSLGDDLDGNRLQLGLTYRL